MDHIYVFLDDYREAPEGYVLVRTIDECRTLLKEYNIRHLSLDHDLVSKKRNGLMLVNMMVDEQLYADRITIHSANASGGKNMYKCLKQAQLDAKMPHSTEVFLRPLPLKSYPPHMLQHYSVAK
ncbi:cyclic-phosphate processing receiver domain-containing protein [Alteribacter natronophilus]|uniref:cyclic-phosphate processing receiver domain-containing protein n=1 Tax=Alteribacter natronophilus TaxID=2583810 RepID=UPI00110EA73E|nr:cyclic-phosphate processing receiver domain-containing protein [Alteribacter natronophilus]TMW70115.1 hypothetical protein FGB90_18275 [Alteribacter natronophilus]